jgi:hypothetical protein
MRVPGSPAGTAVLGLGSGVASCSDPGSQSKPGKGGGRSRVRDGA